MMVMLPGQPACLYDQPTGLIDCGNWSTSASWAVPATATSGIYRQHGHLHPDRDAPPPPPTPLAGPTGGWVKVAGSYQAPAGTTNAQINMVVTSLNATVYVDDLALR